VANDDDIEPALARYLEEIVAILHGEMADELVGVYLHGSLAMGAYDPGRSDVDVLAVCAEPLPRPRRAALGRALDALLRPPGVELEFSLVTRAAIASAAAPPFEVHVTTHEERSVVDGADRPGDEDLVLHFAMTRARGRSLAGPEPGKLFPEPDRRRLIEGFLADLGWGREEGAAAGEGHHEPEFAWIAYRVLNAARSWRYLETGELGSKVEGAEWVQERSDRPEDGALVAAAVAFQHGEPVLQPSSADVEAFVGRIEALLGAEAGARPDRVAPTEP
jgi:predicted nucleotidyltransferase